MNVLAAILGMGAGVYALRLAGLSLPNLALPPAAERALAFLPVALLAALVTTTLAGPSGGDVTRLIAAAGAAVVARLTGRMWACIAAGLLCYWLLRVLSAEL
jgi:branched-subunit amino acid transport protein